MDWFMRAFAAGNFTPHGYCLAWQPGLLVELIVANFGIALAYFVIPIQLYRIVLREDARYIRVSLNLRVTLMFAAFIWLCGFSHVLDIAVLFVPVYWFQAHWDIATAVVSLITAAMLEFGIQHANLAAAEGYDG